MRTNLHRMGWMFLAFLVGCSSTSVPSGDAGGSDSSRPDGAVACPDSSNLPMTSVPSGKPCDENAPVCTFVAGVICNGVENTSSAGNGWTCGCKNERWDCVITSQGGGICVPLPDSGSADDR